MAFRKKKGEKSVKISGTIKPEQKEWIDEKIEQGAFYNVSHIIREGIKELQKRNE